MPRPRDQPYLWKYSPLTYSEFICFRSPMTARARAAAVGTPFFSGTLVLN